MASEEEYRQVACGTLAEDSGTYAGKWSILYVALSVDRCKDIINLLKSSSMPIARTLPGCK